MQSEIQLLHEIAHIRKSVEVLEGTPAITFGQRFIPKKLTAKMLGVSYRTIERWSQQGFIRKMNYGGRIYFSKIEVERIIELYEQWISLIDTVLLFDNVYELSD